MSKVNPIHYRLRLEPDLRRFRLEGSAEVLVEASEPTGEISLNALDLAIWRCQVRTDDEVANCLFSLDPGKEEMRVSLPREMTGKIVLKIDYVAEINNKMAGFYRSMQREKGIERSMALTQFEESDARRAFPCFDHPAMKATFEVEMVIDEDLVALSNLPVSEEHRLGDGRKLVRFQQTPRMSTYLLFFGVGHFAFLEEPGEVLIRLATTPGMTPYGRFGLEFSRKALEFSEDYYGVPYPLPKLDLIAISDFAFGAMENWGAITFRENLLLYDPEKTSRAGEERICEVIAHEIAHQWFGNLVTPADWKFLWLNESFATYFGYGVVDHYYPGWEVWGRFLYSQTDIAFNRDGLHETFPIELPGGEHVVINPSTAPIIYNKGGSILRQIEGYVGKEAFREGLRLYLKRYAYGCATSRDLWEALGEASSKPVSRMMKSWIEQPGFPMVEVRREGETLVLTQERFTYLPRTSGQVWLIPLSVRLFLRDGGTRMFTTLFETKQCTIPIERDTVAYKVNEGERGFYRVKYSERSDLQALGERVAGKILSPEERWGLQNDLYALVRRGDVPLDDYLGFLSHYSSEESFLPLMSIADNLNHAYLVMEGRKRERVGAVGRAFLESTLSRIGFEPELDEKHTASILREQILWHEALYGSEEAKRFGLEKFSSLVGGERLHPDLMRSAMQIGALHGGTEAFAWFERTLSSSESEHERINILTAMGCFREETLIKEVQQYVLQRVPDRNKFMPITAMAANPYAVPLMWEWYLSSLGKFEQLHPMHYERVIGAIVPVAGLGREEEVKGFFEDYMGRSERARDVIRLSLERLEINSRMRQREV